MTLNNSRLPFLVKTSQSSMDITQNCRLSGLSVTARNKAVYMPLIDMPPADPSFVGTVGSRLGESGLAEVMNAGFSGVAKMLNGKKFPQNERALCIIVEELLRKIRTDT